MDQPRVRRHVDTHADAGARDGDWLDPALVRLGSSRGHRESAGTGSRALLGPPGDYDRWSGTPGS